MPESADVEPKDRRTNEWKAWKQRQDVTPSVTVSPAPPVHASSDVAFVNEALARLVLEGKAGKPERCYSDLRSALRVKHILEDAAGLTATGRISLPHWDALGRDRDSGEKFKPGENQMIVDGLAQRAIPAPRAAAAESRPVITNPDGTPLRLARTRLDEPEGVAAFVTPGGESAE